LHTTNKEQTVRFVQFKMLWLKRI